MRALALVYDLELGPPGSPKLREAEQVCDAEIGTYQFRVTSSRGKRARLVPEPDPELDGGLALAL